MLREAEALLASLGIELDKSSLNTDEMSSNTQKETDEYRPSRDELKSSLEIDSTKKDVLARLKEYK